MPRLKKPLLTPEQTQAYLQDLIDGTLSVGNAPTKYPASETYLRTLARTNGLVFRTTGKGPSIGKWTRKETAPMDNGQWNMTTADYEALLQPEPRQAVDNGQVDYHLEADTYVKSASIDDDIQAALDMLARAEQQRKDDIRTIEQLQQQVTLLDGSVVSMSDTANKLRATVDRTQDEVLRLQHENARLMDELKKEISRGLLRQATASLAKVLS